MPRLTCSSRSSRARSSRTSQLRALSSGSASRTGTKEDLTTAPALLPAQALPSAHAPTCSPATLRMLALVGVSRSPSVQVRPLGPSTRPRGQPQVKLPAVLRQWCEQKPGAHSHCSGPTHTPRFRQGLAQMAAGGGSGVQTRINSPLPTPRPGKTQVHLRHR